MAELIKDLNTLRETIAVNDTLVLKIINLKAKHILIKNNIDKIYSFI